jgi:hypothetical protein
MATYNKYNQFAQDLCRGVHNLTSFPATGGTLIFALSNTAGDAAATKAILSEITQTAYTNLSSRALAGGTCTITSGTAHVSATDWAGTASGGTVASFRYLVLYNDTPTSPADPLIAWYDYGSAVTLADGETFTVDFATDIFTLV